MTFVPTNIGLANYAHLNSLRWHHKRHRDYLSGLCGDDRVDIHIEDIKSTLVQIVPITGWICISFMDHPNPKYETVIDPILAIGLNGLGESTLLTASAPGGISVNGNILMHESDHSRVFYNGTTFNSIDEARQFINGHRIYSDAK